MYSFLNSEVGKAISGIIISIGITLAVIFPVLFMDWFANIINLG